MGLRGVRRLQETVVDCIMNLKMCVDQVILSTRVEGEGVWHVSGEERCGSLKEMDHLTYPDVDGSVILKWIFKKWGMDWNDMSLDR